MQLQSDFIESACFLGVKNENGEIAPRASAFYAVVPFRHNRTQGRGYLVTARHNVVKAAGRTLYVSINSGAVGGDRVAAWLPIEVDRWFDHPFDGNADVAVADWRPPDSFQVSYRGILTDNFIDGPPEQNGPIFPIVEGMVTATVGLFSYHSGQRRHTPIVRIGNLSAKPSDRVRTGFGDAEAYLIEARSVGGLSGSPVFIREEVFGGAQRHPLLGLIQGHFDWKDEQFAETWQPIHTGIAVVTPSNKIIDVLRQADCAATRASFDCIF
jgi:hypothetical protein